MTSLSKSSEVVPKALGDQGLQFEVMELSSSTRTATDAAASIGPLWQELQ